MIAPSLHDYRPAWVRRDLFAGATVWAVLVPESLAYATIASVPPVVGLYAAVPALVLYALVGTSKHLVVGPMAATAALSPRARRPAPRRRADEPPAPRRACGGAAKAAAPRGEHPSPPRLPSSRFGQTPGGEIQYTQVAPELVVEVETDTAYEEGRWRHATKYLAKLGRRTP